MNEKYEFWTGLNYSYKRIPIYSILLTACLKGLLLDKSAAIHNGEKKNSCLT